MSYQRVPSRYEEAESASSSLESGSGSGSGSGSRGRSSRLIPSASQRSLESVSGSSFSSERVTDSVDGASYPPPPYAPYSHFSSGYTAVSVNEPSNISSSHEGEEDSKLSSVHIDVNSTSNSTEDLNVETGGAGEGNAGGTGAEMTIFLCRVGAPNKEVKANPAWTVKQLKLAAFPQEMAENKNVRFISMGKLLHDDQIVSDTGVKHESFIHCAITDYRPPEPEPVATEPTDESSPQYMEARIPSWILAEHQQASALQVREGTGADFMLGFVMGFVLGVLALLWMWQRVPRKQKLGIVCGLGCNLFVSFVRVNVDPTAAVNPDPNGTGSGSGSGTGDGTVVPPTPGS